MLLKYFYDTKLAQASYMVGCQAIGEALIIDPSRNIDQYIEAAQQEGLKIRHITETHIHADYVSGSRELAHRTGANLYLSDMGTPDWKYGFSDDPNVILVRDGDSWKVGNIKIQVLHTPGHTPEHISFIVTDTAGANRPMGIFTGDFIFVGDVGRPDLLEEVAGFKNTKILGARQMFQSLQRVKEMPDYLQLWPGHGAGSACGKALGAVPSTTLGYEKMFNPAMQYTDEEQFVNWLLADQPEAPYYFAQMKKVNRAGLTLNEQMREPEPWGYSELQQLLTQEAQVFDMRSRGDFAKGYLPGAINIPADSNFNTYVGWLVNYDDPFYFIAPSDGAVTDILQGLRAIGVDNTPAYFTTDSIVGNVETMSQITAPELAERVKQNGLMILDVRNKSEYEEQHIQGAKHIPLGYLPEHLNELPKNRLIVTHCASGYRSQIAASILRRHGFTEIANLNADTAEWLRALPTE